MVSLLAIVVLAFVAVAMVATTSGLIRWAAFATTQLRASVVLFLLVMMTGMLVGAGIYFESASTSSLVEGFWVASLVMSVSVALVFVQVLREARVSTADKDRYAPAPVRRPGSFVALVVTIVIVNELVMGWVFQRAAGGPVWLGGGGVPPLLVALFVSPWFVFPMALEMGMTFALLGREFPALVRSLLAVQPIAMAASPPTLAGEAWVVGAAVAASAVMALVLAFVLRAFYRGVRLTSASLAFVVALLVAFGVMAGGLALWAFDGNAALFALGVLLQMGVFLSAVLRPARFALLPEPSSRAPAPRGSEPSAEAGP